MPGRLWGTAVPDTSHAHDRQWLEAYLDRGETLKALIGETVQAALAARATLLALPECRAQRATFPRRFCLLLYASRLDRDLLDEADGDDFDAAEEQAVQNLASALDELMPALDEQADTHIVLLERRQQRTPAADGPVRLQPDDPMWFAVFAQLAELAHVIIVIMGANEHLLQEVNYLSKAGLVDRMLVFSAGRLMVLGQDAPEMWWPPNRFGEAVAHAASQPPAQGSEVFIRDPDMPSWFVEGLESAYGTP
jgi:hypothetical protein